MNVLKSAALVSVLFPVSALAQNPATPAAPSVAPAPAAAPAAPAAPETTDKKLTPYLLLQADTFLYDSTSGSAPYYQLSDLRMGVRYKEGIAHGQTTWRLNGKDSFDIRDGFVGVTLPMGFTADFGRVRPKVVDDYGSFYRTGNSYGSLNGIHLAQSFALPSTEAEVHAYYGTDIQAFSAAHQGYAGERPLKAEKAYIVTAKGTVNESIKLALSYAAEANAIRSTEDYNASTLDTAGDVSQLAFSVGYSADGLAGGVYYNKFDYAKTKRFTKGEKADTIKTGKDYDDATDASVIGLGASVESSVFDVKDIFQSGDYLSFGASYEMYGFKEDEANHNDLTVSAGYLVGGVDIELNVVQYAGEEKIYKDAKGKSVKNSSAVFLTGFLEI